MFLLCKGKVSKDKKKKKEKSEELYSDLNLMMDNANAKLGGGDLYRPTEGR